ncbi:hypothetical protein VSR01_17295 [Actinacidiphila sp. DG2A-62]|uniref:hypothetical protein n=1 Tax=Actinacidiphila sp. DG2A-62 TaxID=3108821 RepID=UPI002DB934D6|nr:hypothetical protein [Actinacidiphila sp. DG2A-62]MEC3995194.1 hypothetical protein [Actinacidiphila sp. DG2A-62]
MSAQDATPHPTRCLKCHRILRCPSPDGYGPKCRRKIRRATKAPELGQYKPHLVEKAVELLEQGAVVPLRRTGKNRVFLVVSSDGGSNYRTARAACNCPAGLKAIYMCKHRIAVHALEIAS